MQFKRLISVSAGVALATTAFAGLGTGPASAAPAAVGTAKCLTSASGSDTVDVGGYKLKKSKMIKDHKQYSRAQIAKMEKRFAKAAKAKGIDGTARTIHTVPVYFHIVMNNGGKGNIAYANIKKQLDVMNSDFTGKASPTAKDTSIRFKLAKVVKYKNTAWFDGASTAAQQYKPKTRVGGANALNVWSTDLIQEGLLGYAQFPWEYKASPGTDGVVFDYRTVPGGTAEPYNLGRTLTHEVGHWVGLWHTFQDGCTSPNDWVRDTPREAQPNFGDCSTKPDTCTQPGKDPISNFMDYSDDLCLTDYTKWQTIRIKIYYEYFRM